MISNRPVKPRVSPVLVLLTFVLNILIFDGRFHGRATTNQLAADEKSADGKDSPVTLRFNIEANSRFGVLNYVPGQWGDLQLRLENNSDTARDLLCSSYFGDQSTLQFGRQIWIPPHSRLNLSHPVLLPPIDQLKSGVAEVRSLVIDKSSGQEVLLKNDGGQLLHERSLLVNSTERKTAVIAGWRSEETPPEDALDLIVAGRVNQALNTQLTVLTGQFLPSDEASLKCYDHIVLMENRLQDDFAALTSLRRWLHAGGRLWIMLDRTDPVLIERLLGDDYACHLIDRVDLTTVKIDTAASLLAPDGKPGETLEYTEPVQLSRIAASGMTVKNTVDGWPAAMTASFGEGRVLVTTLGARAWIRPNADATPGATPPAASSANGSSATPPAADSLLSRTSKFIPVSPMEDLAAFVLGQRTEEPISRESLESLAQEFIAYEIPSWTLIVSIMSGFLVLLALQGVWLSRAQKLEHFGWIGSLTAIAFGIVLTGIGFVNRYGVPETVASVQFAQTISGTDDMRSEGIIGVFRREPSTVPVGTVHGGRFWPDMTGQEGSTRRMVTTDLGTWRWEGLSQPSGLRLYPNESSRLVPDRVTVEATLNSDGLVGRLTGTIEGTTDTIVATRHGRLAVKLTGDGQLAAPASGVLEAGQYLDAAFLGDVQDRRQRILKQMFENAKWRDSLVRPHMLVWLKNWEHGFQLGEKLEQHGETLMSIPFELTRPALGTDFVIPSPLISYASCLAPDGSLPAGAWDDKLGEWQERSGANTTWLRFLVPQTLLPLKATKAKLNLKVSGDMGQIEILGAKEATELVLQTRKSPAGSISFEIEDPAALEVSPDGGIRLGFRAGLVPDPTAEAPVDLMAGNTKSYWRIESLSLELSGVTTDQPVKE
jgi:hypothetical protein